MSRLTPTSYVVLGLIASHGPSTSYELKRAVHGTIGDFWAFPHSQLYAEPARLARQGLLEEQRELGGRRRRTYRLTDRGREALQGWLGEPTTSGREVRDLALLKLFFGCHARSGDVRRLAHEQVELHRRELDRYLASDDRLSQDGALAYERETLRFGLAYEAAAVQFWTVLAERSGDDA